MFWFYSTNIAGGSSSNIPINKCIVNSTIIAYNPLSIEQTCYNPLTTTTYIFPPKQFHLLQLPCEIPGPLVVPTSSSFDTTSSTTTSSTDSNNKNIVDVEFDKNTGMMIRPIREEWMVWKVKKGGAYLFFPDILVSYIHDIKSIDDTIIIKQNGFLVQTKYWNHTIIQKQVHDMFLQNNNNNNNNRNITITVYDFIYETLLTINNNDWIVRYSTYKPIYNKNKFYTDLNGFNFDTHIYRSDRPIQSQVYPMSSISSIQDKKQQLTIISTHAQGTASLMNNTIDVWLDRRLIQDDNKGLGQGITDNVPTQTRFRIILEEQHVADEDHDTEEDNDDTNKSNNPFNSNTEYVVTDATQYMWDTLQHPLEYYGNHQ